MTSHVNSAIFGLVMGSKGRLCAEWWGERGC